MPSRRLLSLGELATNKIIQNINHINDIGTTPFHLLEPVLIRMNAKQLNQIEVTSPQLMPETDSLWYELVERDFPNRPAPPSKTRRLGSTEPMPNKSLYYQYVEERESFRNDSAKRLRRITEKLKLEKSANQIVKVQELLKDPTVKRKTWNPYSASTGTTRFNTSGPHRNSILNKARRDLQHRPMMFSQASTKKYDAFDAFKVQKSETISVRHPRPRTSHVTTFGSATDSQKQTRKPRPTTSSIIRQTTPPPPPLARFTTTSTSSSNMPTQLNESRSTRSVSSLRAQPTQLATRNIPDSTSPVRPQSPGPSSQSTHNTVQSPTQCIDTAIENISDREHSPVKDILERKRRPPSIFLSSKRAKPPVKRPTPKPAPEQPRNSTIKAVKSSIFS